MQTALVAERKLSARNTVLESELAALKAKQAESAAEPGLTLPVRAHRKMNRPCLAKRVHISQIESPDY